jgi:hypothetical protein
MFYASTCYVWPGDNDRAKDHAREVITQQPIATPSASSTTETNRSPVNSTGATCVFAESLRPTKSPPFEQSGSCLSATG